MALTPNDLYAQVWPTYQYFLTWREKLLAGYIVICAGLAAGFAWLLTNHRGAVAIVPAVAAVLNILFWALDRRNRELFYRSVDAGAELERTAAVKNKDGEPVEPVYTRLNAPPKATTLRRIRIKGRPLQIPMWTHTQVLSVFFWGGAVVLAFFAIVLARLEWDATRMIWARL